MGPVTIRRLVLDNQDAETAYNASARFGATGTGTAMNIAVLFSDIRGFTSFSERSYPYDVMHILNRYLYNVGESIHRHNGYIDKYIGDGVMVLFGMGGEGPETSSQQAVNAAIDMIDDLKRFNIYMAEQFGEHFDTGIGIHVGEVVVGEVGHPSRKQLTAIGDVVNTASRIESSTKTFAAKILISDDVYQHVASFVEPGQVVEATMKGKSKPHRLTEILGRKASTVTALRAQVYITVLQSITRMDAPGLLRLAFHDAIDGGSNASIRSPKALEHPSNRGLEIPLKRLEKIKDSLPEISWADLIALGGAAAVERCGGPFIPLKLGRVDADTDFDVEALPDRHEDAQTLSQRFAKCGLSNRDLVALSGAHTLGKADGTPFTADPFSFTNSYFQRLMTSHVHLIDSDRALLTDPKSRSWVEEYAENEPAFFADFVSAYRIMCR
jgi:adenylate cyclase